MDNKLSNSTRRQIIKSIGVAGFIGIFGVSSVKEFIGTARASTDYKDHFQQLTSDHGDLVQTEIANHQKISSSCFNCGDYPDDGGGGGGGSTETDTPDPTPTPTEEPDPTPTETPEPNDGPTANISVDSNSVVGMSVEMSAGNSYDPDGYVSSYDWEFGDGSSASGENVSHTYDSLGTHTITLTVHDNDGAADHTSTVIYVGDEWTVGLSFEDGTTIDEHAHQTGEDVWEVVSDGVDFVGEVTDEMVEGVNNFVEESISGAKSQYSYPEVSNSTTIDVTSGSEETINGENLSQGTSSVGGYLPNWIDGTIPFAETAYADWETGGLVEVSAMSKAGGAYGMSSVAASFKVESDSIKSGYIDINYDWAVHLATAFASAELIISPFARNVTTGHSEIVDYTQEKVDLLSRVEGTPIPFPNYSNPDESTVYSISMNNNNKRDLRFKDGDVYQAGIRVLLNAAAPDKDPGVFASGHASDPNSGDEHPAGDEQLPHNAFDGQSNRVVLNSISPRW